MFLLKNIKNLVKGIVSNDLFPGEVGNPDPIDTGKSFEVSRLPKTPEEQAKDTAKAILQCKQKEATIRELNAHKLDLKNPEDCAYCQENAKKIASCQKEIDGANAILKPGETPVTTTDGTEITTGSGGKLVTEGTKDLTETEKLVSQQVSFTIDEDGNPELPEGTFKDLKSGGEIQFSLEGLEEEDLENATYGTWLPDNVSSIKVGDKEYKRIGGEFTDEEGNPLPIEAGQKVTIGEVSTRTPEQLKQDEANITQFLGQNPEYNKPEEKGLITKLFKSGEPLGVVIGLIGILLGGKIDFNNLSPETTEVVSNRASVLEKRGQLDNSRYATGRQKELPIGKGELPPGINNESIPENLRPFVSRALSEVGTNEHIRGNEGADKYLSGQNSAKIPWCAGFINWCLKNSGFENCATGKLTAKSFINGNGFGHVGIKLGNNILGGNQGNKVSVVPISKQIAGYAVPTEKGLEMHNFSNPKEEKLSNDKIPNGAIIVFDRNTANSSDRKYS